MSKIKKIGVLTGGGDCPGLNPAIKAVVNRALVEKISVVGIKDGWRGLVSNNPDLWCEMNNDIVRHIDRFGGTMLGTSRTNPFSIENGVKKLKRDFNALELDALVAIGGEDTLGVASRLYSEENMKVVGIPKTIDRDLGQTQYTLGFESALQVITDSVDALRSTAESHARIFVVEVMGRHAGHLALRGGISAGASEILIPECNFDVQKICDRIIERRQRGIRYSIIMIAEGAKPISGFESLQSGQKDAFGHLRLGGVGQWLSDEIAKRTSLESRSVNLSHLQRGGCPVAYDRRMGFYFGTAAIEGIVQGKFGKMPALIGGCVTLVSIKKAVEKLCVVDIDKFYDKNRYNTKFAILGKLGPVDLAAV